MNHLDEKKQVLSRRQVLLRRQVLSRRALLKALSATGSAALLSTLPAVWERPVVKVGALPAFALVSHTPTLDGMRIEGPMGPCPAGGGVIGNLYSVSLDYTQGNMVADQAKARLIFEFIPAGSATDKETEEVLSGANITGSSSSGTVVLPICIDFGNATSVNLTMLLINANGTNNSQGAGSIPDPGQLDLLGKYAFANRLPGIIWPLSFSFLIWLLACTAGVTPPAPTALPAPHLEEQPLAMTNKLGIHLLLDDARHTWPLDVWPTHMQYARQVAGKWGYVTQLVRLDNLDLNRWQMFMDLCAERQLQPILRLATTQEADAPYWTTPPRDADGSYRTVAVRYAAFIAGLTWPTSNHYITVGNEPNHGNEWGGRPDPAAYARFLIDVAEALHAADPQARVLNAGFDPYTPHTGDQPFIDGQFYMDEETFLDEMVAAQPHVFTQLDLWASHPYPLGPLTAPPWQQTFQRDLINGAVNPGQVEPPPGLYNRGINGYEWELFKLSTYGLPPLPVMITETGWRHAETTDATSPDDGPLRPDGTLPDAKTVALYLDMALYGNRGRYPDLPETGWTPWLDDPRVVAITPFALNGLPALWGHTNWLALDETGQVLFPYALVETQAAYAR